MKKNLLFIFVAALITASTGYTMEAPDRLDFKRNQFDPEDQQLFERIRRRFYYNREHNISNNNFLCLRCNSKIKIFTISLAENEVFHGENIKQHLSSKKCRESNMHQAASFKPADIDIYLNEDDILGIIILKSLKRAPYDANSIKKTSSKKRTVDPIDEDYVGENVKRGAFACATCWKHGFSQTGLLEHYAEHARTRKLNQ